MVSARNVLLLYIVLSNGFDPENTDNLDYLWTVWYSLQWTEDTRKRFIKDVEQLLSKNWTINGKVNISELEGVVVLKKMLSSWQDMASCNFVPQKAASILKKTFVTNFLWNSIKKKTTMSSSIFYNFQVWYHIQSSVFESWWKSVQLNDRESLTSKLISNPSPFCLQSSITLAKSNVGLHVSKCCETTEDFQFDIAVHGFQLNNVKGKHSSHLWNVMSDIEILFYLFIFFFCRCCYFHW